MIDKVLTRISVNGVVHERWIEPRQHLVDYLRDELGLKGTRTGCEQGVCGACAVRIDGETVRGCLTLAVQADGALVETIEGVSDSGAIGDLQHAFLEHNALQCGFCTAGMLLSADDLLKAEPGANREQIRAHMSGNYCRCSGYHAIVDAVETTRETRRLATRSGERNE